MLRLPQRRAPFGGQRQHLVAHGRRHLHALERHAQLVADPAQRAHDRRRIADGASIGTPVHLELFQFARQVHGLARQHVLFSCSAYLGDHVLYVVVVALAIAEHTRVHQQKELPPPPHGHIAGVG